MIARRKPIKRGKPPKRSGRIKPKKRSASEFARIYGSKERVAWVKSQPCVYCNALSPFFGESQRGPSHNAHTVTGGMGRKAGFETIVPLCASHHRRYDEHLKPFDDPDLRHILKTIWARSIAARWDMHVLRNALASLLPLEASPK